jgi:hypothetical protein
MQSWTKACWASLIAASLVAVAHADDVAVVHITDRPAPVPDPGPGAPATTSAPVANGAACDGAGVGVGGYLLGSGGWYNPTEGFRPYAGAPVYREAIAYQRYWPDKWYGEPGFNLRPMFPQVYMPTDTTQQGFYYARVPQWMPNPNMYPPAPRPEDWHRHVVYAAGGGACGGVGAGVSVGAGTDGGTPTLAPGQPTPAQPMPPQPPAGPPASLGNPAAQPVAPPQAMPPSAAIQQDSVQPAAATTEHHGFILDLMNSFSRNRNQQVAPASGMQQQPQEGQAPAAQ